MRKFQQYITEGVYDPSIFKAFFLAGGPGSGKSFVSKSALSGMGLKVINSDAAFESKLKKETCMEQSVKRQYGLCAHTAFTQDRWQQPRKKNKKLAKKYILKIEENNDKYSPLKKLRINNLELKCAIWKHRK